MGYSEYCFQKFNPTELLFSFNNDINPDQNVSNYYDDSNDCKCYYVDDFIHKIDTLFDSGLIILSSLNIRNIQKFLDKLLIEFDMLKIDIFCVSETWLNEHTYQLYIMIPNFFQCTKPLKEASGTLRRRRLGAGHLGAWTIGRQNSVPDYCRFFLASFFCGYVVSVCSSLRSR